MWKNIVGTIDYKGDDEATIVSWLRFFLEKMDKKVAENSIPLSLKIYIFGRILAKLCNL